MTPVTFHGARQRGGLGQRTKVGNRVGVLPDKIVSFATQGAAHGGHADGKRPGWGCNKGGGNVTGVQALLPAGVLTTKAEKRSVFSSSILSSALLRRTNTLDPQGDKC